MRAAIVLFTRDLRIHDNAALAEATRVAERIVPLFVLDDRILASSFAAPNRLAFLLDCLEDLAETLAALGAPLQVRRGDPVTEVMRLARETGAGAVYLAADVSRFAARRFDRLTAACNADGIAVLALPGVTAVPPGALHPSGSDHYRVFTPYHRRWAASEHRAAAATPRRLQAPEGLTISRIPPLSELTTRPTSKNLPEGGEAAARKLLQKWLKSGLARYPDAHDDMAADATSRLSPYLHFGCISPLEIVREVSGRPGAEPFLRQLCWRDFFHQLLAANPRSSVEDLRPRGDRWRNDPGALEAWREGRTGYPIVDAGMRQLAAEGWMHNRARLVAASFLTKHLYIDWRLGAARFFDLLVDGDVAVNCGNWQWAAGTGADTRPNRLLNPVLQGKRYDPQGSYVRRYVPELADAPADNIHKPWRLDASVQRGYPDPIVDLKQAAGRFRAARSPS